jgi:hypothetical protein
VSTSSITCTHLEAFGTEEPQPDLGTRFLADELSGHAHRVTQAEAEDLGVEPQRFDVVEDRDHDVSHALISGDELGGVRRHDGTRFISDAVEELKDVVPRVGELDHLLDPTVGELLGSRLLVDNAGVLEVLARVLQGNVVSQLPAGGIELVDVGREDDDPGRDGVEAEVQVLWGRTATLGNAEDLARKGLPGLQVGARDPDVPHGFDVDHGVASSGAFDRSL